MEKAIEFENAIKNEDFSQLNKCIQESTARLTHLLEKSELDKLEEEIDIKKSQLSFYIKRELFDKNPHFIFGRYIGFLDTLYSHLLFKLKRKRFVSGINSYSLYEVPHINDIIYTLHTEDGIRHGKLAEKVGLDKSTLTGIMDKLVKKGAVQFTRPGKYKYYYLTDIGNQYFRDNQKTIEASVDIDALIEQLLLALSREPDVNSNIIKIIKSVCNGKNKYEKYTSNASKAFDPALIFSSMPAFGSIKLMTADNSIRSIDKSYAYTFEQGNSVVTLISNGALLDKECLHTADNSNLIHI